MLEEISTTLYGLLTDAVDSCKSDYIALSGGLDSTVLAYCLRHRPIKGIVVITKDFLAKDLTYSQLVAKEFGLELVMKIPTIEEVFSAIEDTIKILKNFNHIEIRNSIVMYLVLKKAVQENSAGLVTGDGADELFAGYNFFLKKSNEQIQKDLERIWEIMHFPTQKIGNALGIPVESPFLSEKVDNYARSIPVDLKVNTRDGKKFGKWILRKMFENKIPKSVAWRDKSPMEDGAGTSGLTSFFEGLVPDDRFESKKKEYFEKDRVSLQSKESLYYYETYRKYFEAPSSLNSSDSKCPYCQAGIKRESRFCRMCGSLL